MFCPECGNQAEESYKFCPECGFNLAALIKRRNQGVTTRGDEPAICAESQNQKGREHTRDVKEDKNNTDQEKVQPDRDDLQPAQGVTIPPEHLENTDNTTVSLFHHQVDIGFDAGSASPNKIEIAKSDETDIRLSDTASANENTLQKETAQGSDVSVTRASPPTIPASETFVEQRRASVDGIEKISNDASRTCEPASKFCGQSAPEHNLVGKQSAPEQEEENTITNETQTVSADSDENDHCIKSEVQKCEEAERKGNQDDPSPSTDVTTQRDEPTVFAESQNQKEIQEHMKYVKEDDKLASETFMEQQRKASVDDIEKISNDGSRIPCATAPQLFEQTAQEHNLVGKPSTAEQDEENTIGNATPNMSADPGKTHHRIKSEGQKCEETERKGNKDSPSQSTDVSRHGYAPLVCSESSSQKGDQEHTKEEMSGTQKYNNAAHGSDVKGGQARRSSNELNTDQRAFLAKESSVDPFTEAQATEYSHLQQSGSRDATVHQSSISHSNQNRGQGLKANISRNQQYPQQSSTNKDLIFVYFYVVTSKNLSFDPRKDEVHLKSEGLFGSWEHFEKMIVIKSLEDNRYLVRCGLWHHRANLHNSIPYKYAVCWNNKQKIEYEAIYYKKNSDHVVNRCLSVKPELLTAKGEWHQYDDVLHLHLKRDWYFSIEGPVIKARDQAGLEMLKSIFDHLTTWSEDSVNNFFVQLQQFIHTFSNPLVHVGWESDWGLPNCERQVKNQLKQFLMDITSEYQRIPHLHSGILSLLIWSRFLKMDGLNNSQLSNLCTRLCLPSKEQGSFCSFWENFAVAIGDKNGVADDVEKLCRTARQKNIKEWVVVIPLIHLLRGAKPFQQLPPVLNPQPPLLTGLRVNDTRVVQVMKEHRYLVDIDNLLAHSWMSLLNVNELLRLISYVPIKLLDILHGIELKIKFHQYEHEPLERVVSHLVKRETSRCSSFENTYEEFCLRTAVRLLDYICSHTTDPKCCDVPLALLDLICLIAKRFHHTDSQSGEKILDELINMTLNTTREWRRKTFPKKLLRGEKFSSLHEIKVWVKLLSLLSGEKHSSLWSDTFTDDFEGKLRNEDQEAQIGIYINKMEELRVESPLLCKSMEKCALEAIGAICQKKSGKALLDLIKRHDITKFGRLISVVVLESWPKAADGNIIDGEDLIFEYLLNWPMAKTVFQIIGVRETLIGNISDDACTLMTLATSAFRAMTEKFLSGEIQLKNVDQILQKEREFVDLLSLDVLCEDYRCKDESNMKNLMNQRKEEANAVHNETEMVKTLLQFCQELPQNVKVDFNELDKKFHQNIQLMSLNKFRKVYTFGGQTPHTTEEDTYYNLHGIIRQMASELHTVKDSSVFKLCWTNQVEELSKEKHDAEDTEHLGNEEVYTLDLVYSKIFQSCYNKYRKLYDDLKSGNLLLEEIDSIFEDYRGHYTDLQNEFSIMRRIDASDAGGWIKDRVNKVQQYHELDLAVDSAKIIMGIRNIICPEGNFDDLEKLQNMDQDEFKRSSLNVIDEALITVKNILKEITNERRQCLEQLCVRSEFVKWVRAALEGINELKVFVDLASISAGENDLEVDRVACFHDAVLGYSSILFGLPQDTNFDVFKESLTKLWKALENDPKIPQKLQDTARQLDWLKTVKDSHGSVEFSSLSLATSINERGIYIIKPQNHNKVTLDTSLMLQLQNGPENKITCTYDDLKELQNKLMLMSGKRDDNRSEVDHFTQVFDNVQRLAKVFVDLYATGNPLFRSWKAEIYCKIQHNPSIIMEINFCKTHHIEICGSLSEQLRALSKKMELFLDDWQKFMDKQRSDNYYLNYFTAEQIFYLCSVVTPVNENTEIEDKALTMLSFIRPNCTTSDVWSTWKKFHSQFEPGKMISETVAFQSHFDYPEDHDEKSLSVSDFSPDDLVGNVDQIVGLKELEVLWNGYMKNEEILFHDVLDIRSLGELLKMMTITESQHENEWEEPVLSNRKDNSFIRCLPKGLLENVPNLIICPNDEILTSSICLYMSSEYNPLPSYDEVLLCTPKTSVEEVELFLRRCLTPGDVGKKIYSMLRADQLSYDVSSAMEKYFQKFCTLFKHEYRLAIFCSADKEHAYIPTAFSQFKRDFVPQEPLENIQEYLSRHYTVDSNYTDAAFKGRHSVGIVASTRAGLGKSLYIDRLYEKLERSVEQGMTFKKCIRLTEFEIDDDKVLESLYNTPKQNELKMFHFDVTATVQKGLNEFLFKLLFLRYLMHSDGRLWHCTDKHMYVIELLQSSNDQSSITPGLGQKENIAFLDIFPKVICHPPKKVMELEENTDKESHDPLMDDQCFRSEAYQRPYQYLRRFFEKDNLDKFTYKGIEGTHGNCLQILLFYCGILDPSWAELHNFVRFLNMQLKDCENSDFCNFELVGDELDGFKNFVVEFMILMSKDFATPSLCITDQSTEKQQMDTNGLNEKDLAPFLIRRRWETAPHPYIFFNDDHVSMTFIGFHLVPNSRRGFDAINPLTKKTIKENIMTRELYAQLKHQGVPFNEDFDQLPRDVKIAHLCKVLGVKKQTDPDQTYELTTDNILKILAIHMRFRCGIPVIIMGETGCGKTRLIKFMCELRRSGAPTENMKLVKVHGGTSTEMIYEKVKEAQTLARTNKEKHGCETVLFFDEANTTEAISSIKEIMCDNSVKGQQLCSQTGLQIIAACNPYRKHTEEMINRLEASGLGYRIRAEETEERLGSIPLRQLVYRVHVLPPSMIPLVWDFGQLNDVIEQMYIEQIVQRQAKAEKIEEEDIQIISQVMSLSQNFMREKKDECSFVSLRDVERCMHVLVWFHKNYSVFSKELKAFIQRTKQTNTIPFSPASDRVIWSLLMATAVCYQACLEKKMPYWKSICEKLPNEYRTKRVQREIQLMQDFLLSGVPMDKTIAKNDALKENFFMMVISIELRIPLFIVGKPGSSKSLSKTLIADAMQGGASHSEVFKRLKQVHLVSFQCSPHSTPEGIINTFKQCSRFQENKNLDEYISVVVLDEIGLAEDSPKMPLKTLHPLLEEGCIDDEPQAHKRVGFIGISNWALDPAKMNRGIFVSRGDPEQKELVKTARGICSSEKMILEKIKHLFTPFAKAYTTVCKEAKDFFGLRDFYSLVKMVFSIAKIHNECPNTDQIAGAILRNFSGKDDIDVMDIFGKELKSDLAHVNTTTIDLIQQSISQNCRIQESRYLLVLTKNYAALQILQQLFLTHHAHPEIIFGSSFPKDQEYTQICRNINRVKVCMETGQTVVLLNLQNLYESLYDALNQYYVTLGGLKYVDLGLGTHRVKCRVHDNFRLIVIEEKEVVYKMFPIPLINRLEKHYLDVDTVLRSEQKNTATQLKEWVDNFVTLRAQSSMQHEPVPSDVFIGYHSDTCSSVVFQVTEGGNPETDAPTILDKAKCILLKCATPDSVVRLDKSKLPDEERTHMINEYSKEQMHTSLGDYILFHTQQEDLSKFFIEVTTFSRLLTATDMQQLKNVTNIDHIMLLSLYQFDTEYSFLNKIREFLGSTSADKVLIIQADYDEHSHQGNILSSAKFSCTNEINKCSNAENTKTFVYFVTRLPRIEGGTSYVGFPGGPWGSVHIDDLRRSREFVSDVNCLKNQRISNLFEDPPEVMDVDEDTQPTQNELSPALEHLVDTTDLIRSCVQSAVSMLKDASDSRQFSTKRVESLLTLLNGSETQGDFGNILRKRLYLLLLAYESEILNPKGWVLNEASNVSALQDGGTFLHTLWRKIQAVITPLLANVISVIDRDCNLNLLLGEKEEIKNLWLEIFANSEMLHLPYVKMENKVLMVQSHVTYGSTMQCAMPFSWWIKDFLDGLMMQTVRHEKQSYKHVFEVFSKTPFGSCMKNMSRQSRGECFERYLKDFVFMTLKVEDDEALQLMCQALTSCVHETRKQKRDEDELSLLHLHIAYHFYQSRLQNLSRMISLQPEIVSLLRKQQRFRDCPEMALDVYAAIACIERLGIWTVDTDEFWQHWQKDVKSLQASLELIISQHKSKYYGEQCKERMLDIHKGWQRLYILSLFVEHMLLGFQNEERQHRTLVLDHIHTLSKVLRGNADVKSMSGFQAVVQVLKSCKQGANEQLFRFGSQCRVCMSEPREPVELPCHHLYCITCIRACLDAEQTSCPNCRQQLPNDFQPHVSESIRASFKKFAEFSRHCDGFFIDLLSMVCFKDNTPPSKDVIIHLLSYLTVETGQQIRTNKLTPFDESPDENPVVRSVILKLLLKFSFGDIKEYLQKHLSSIEESNFVNEEDKAELYALYINCLEDSMWEQIPQDGIMAGAMSQFYHDEPEFMKKFCTESTSAPAEVSIQQLQDVARLRLSLTLAAELISETLSDNYGPDGADNFLKTVVELCEKSGNDWYRVYLIRMLSERFGAEFIQALVKRPDFIWLIPVDIRQQIEHGAQMDQYLVYGENYKMVRDAVAKALIEADAQQIEDVCEKCNESPQRRTVYILLALFREITTLYRSENTGPPLITPELDQAFEEFISGSAYLTSVEVRNFAKALVHNKLGALTVHAGLSIVESTVIELTVHLAAVLLTSTHPLLMPLNQLGLFPENMQMAYIPTMPDDMLAVAQAAIQQNSRQLTWYECPNNHPCCVDECGLPMQRIECPECGVEIGGENHIAVPGFNRILLQEDRTRHGHILGDPAERNKPNTLDTKDMSLTPFLMVRLVSHLAMLLGSSEKHDNIKQIIHPPVENANLFLTEHIQKDIDQLNQALGKGADDCLTAIHMVLRSLLDQPVKTSHTIDPKLTTKQSRNTWDTTMAGDIMTPQLTILDQFLPQVRGTIKNDSRVSTNLIIRLISGDECAFLRSLSHGSQIHSSAVWSCRKRLSLLSLTHIVEHTDKKEELPILWRFLQKEKEFRLIKFLPDILSLQKVLVRHFQNASDQIVGSIGEFIDKQTGKRSWYEKHIDIFQKTWNLLRLSVTNNELKIPEEFCSHDLDRNSDLQYLLPQRQGPGLCATGLVSYLVTLHNELVYVMDRYTGEDSSSYKVGLVELTGQHVISYDLEKDLLPLLLSNCQYSLERGQETISQYDLPRIQQQILTHFIQGKPLISLTGIPTLVNTQDRDYESTFKTVKGKVRQEHLPSLRQTGISRELCYSEVCEALKIVELVLGFLSMTGGDPKMPFVTYLQDVLKITDTDPHIVQVLNRCALNHCVSLWQLLSFLRSENMLHLNREPFGTAYSEYQKPLSEEEKTELRGFVLRRKVDQWWFELHEFLLLNLGRPRSSYFYNPEWSVKETMIAHMDGKEMEVPKYVEEEFPENMQLSQIVEIWKCAVTARRDNMNK